MIYRNTKGRPGQLLRPALAGAALALAGLALTVATPAFAGSGRYWAHIAAGFDHTCGITTSGTLWCWGANDHGQLGIGSTTSQSLPRPVTTPRQYGWASVATGANRTCAIRTDHTVWCWGTTYTSSQGTTTDLTRPRQNTFPGRYSWTSVTVGGDQICAIRSNASLWCWGGNYTGELGIGGSANAVLPRQVHTPARLGWASASAGSDYTCAVHTDSTLWCWGFGFFGQPGLGTNKGVATPHQVTGPAPAGWASVTAGTAHTCAVRTDGTLWCWGKTSTVKSASATPPSSTCLSRSARPHWLPLQVTGCRQLATRRSSAGGWRR